MIVRALLAAAALALAATSPASAQVMPSAEAVKSLAPQGRLRVAINLGNPVLAQRDPATGALGGASVTIANELGKRLNVPVDVTVFDAAGKVFEAITKGDLDVAFMAVEPERAALIDFSQPYVLIEGAFLVRADGPFRAAADVDRPGVKISVGRGAAYDLYLTRTIKHAELVRVDTSQAAIATFLRGDSTVAAGVRQAAEATALTNPGLRVTDSFQRIEQAVATPRGRDAGARFIRDLLEELKASGVLRRALDDSGQTGAAIAPPLSTR